MFTHMKPEKFKVFFGGPFRVWLISVRFCFFFNVSYIYQKKKRSLFEPVCLLFSFEQPILVFDVFFFILVSGVSIRIENRPTIYIVDL